MSYKGPYNLGGKSESDFATAAQGALADNAVSRDLALLNEIAETKALTGVVDVFVYDTSKDSDGGAWRKRTQHTSWYNETLNTATRGSRKEFPAVAVIVAESDKVTIYDGDDPSLPMWMVFNASTLAWKSNAKFIAANSITSISMLNAELQVGGDYGTPAVNFITEETKYRRTFEGLARHKKSGAISERNDTSGFYTIDSTKGVVNFSVNDVAITVLPNAPIDPATGLPVPTISVCTDGNGTYSTSVIQNNGSVYGIASDSTGTAVSCSFGSDGSLTVARSDGTAYIWDDASTITSNGVAPDSTITDALGAVSEVVAA